MGLKYLDFGYWIGVPKNSTYKTEYTPFIVHGGGWNAYTASNAATYTGKAAAVAYNSAVPGSAHELGGTATLEVSDRYNAKLKLDFDNYYTFDMTLGSSSNGTPSSVIVNGTNTNGGPAFTSCVSGCSAGAGISYVGQYGIEEVGGVYHYSDGNNKLYGSFGAK